MVLRNVAAMIHRQATSRIQPVRVNKTTPPGMSFRPQRSGVEESTTLGEKPTQDKTCNLGRFLDSLSLPRNDISVGGFVFLHGFYSLRCMAMNHRRYIGCTVYWVIPFNHTGCIRNVAGGRLPPLRTHRGVVSSICTDCNRNVPGTAHRPFPTVSLIRLFFNRRGSKTPVF